MRINYFIYIINKMGLREVRRCIRNHSNTAASAATRSPLSTLGGQPVTGPTQVQVLRCLLGREQL